LEMDTPSLVIVGAPHFFSRTTLRPLGPSVTFTASARVFIPRSRPRRASSLNAMILGMYASPPAFVVWVCGPGTTPATDGPVFPALHTRRPRDPRRTNRCHSHG